MHQKLIKMFWECQFQPDFIAQNAQKKTKYIQAV